MRRRTVLWLMLMALGLAASLASAQRLRSMPTLLRIEAYVGPKPEGVVTEASWTVNVRDKRYDLQVTKLRVLSGQLAYFNVINALEPYPIAFTIYGGEKLLDKFAATPADRKVVLEGSMLLGGGPRSFMVSSVELVDPDDS